MGNLQLIGQTIAAFVAATAFTACEQASTQDSETRLIYLAPQMPCEAGEPGFGQPNCFIRRKRDSLVVLRVPKNYGGSTLGMPERFSTVELGIEPNGFLVEGTGKLYKEKETIKKLQAAMKNGINSDKQNTFYMGLSWGWRYSNVLDGHADARNSMESWYKNIGSQPGNEDLNYVEIVSPAAEFKAYAMQRCVGHMLRMSSKKGRLTPEHFCDIARRYYLPIDDPRTSVSCQAPWMGDDKLDDGSYCRMESHFTLRQVDGKQFNIYYTYSPTWEHMKSGHWKYLNQRFEAWVKSMDVTDQELSRSKK
jgi:hypothetical protein